MPERADNEIRIELPLAMDIASTLLNVIGLTWPRTQIKDDQARHSWDRQLVLVVDERDRHKTAKKRKKYLRYKKHRGKMAEPATLTELGPNAVGVGANEYLTKLWISLARQIFNDYPDATNYLESTAYDRDDHTQYVFWVAKSKRQTPHALRQEAEARADRAEAQVATLKGGFSTCQVCGAFGAMQFCASCGAEQEITEEEPDGEND